MVYINVTQDNEFVLNINNNSRNPFPEDSVDVLSTHILSDHSVNRTCEINPPSGDPSSDIFFAVTNGRYSEFWMSRDTASEMFIYDGEYDITITNGNEILYKGIWKATGNSEAEENPFIEYTSDNERNDNYIYIEE
jgi:hypothetical protein